MSPYLITRVITSQVAFATVNAHLLINQSYHMLLVIEHSIGTDTWQGSANYFLDKYMKNKQYHLESQKYIEIFKPFAHFDVVQFSNLWIERQVFEYCALSTLNNLHTIILLLVVLIYQ